MSNPKSASEFFESWVPERVKSVLDTGVKLNTRCSIAVSVGAQGWVLAVNQGQLEVKSIADGEPSNLTFRVAVSPTMFERFVLTELVNVPPVPSVVPANSPLFKLFNLDDESLSLVQNLPGSLHLVVNDEDDSSYRASFAPGSQSLEPAACTLKCSLADAQALRAGTAQPMELFFGGRLQLEGDPQVAMAIAGLLL